MSCPSWEVFLDTTRILLEVATDSPLNERLEVLRTMLKIVVKNESIFNLSNKSTRKLLRTIKLKSDEACRYDQKFSKYSERIEDMLGYKGPVTRSRAKRR